MNNPITPVNYTYNVSNFNKTPNVNTDQDPQKLMEVCKQFEAIFINMMLKQMRKTVQEGNFIEKSFAREIYESMHDEQISEEMAKGQGIGLAQQLYKQLLRNFNIKLTDHQE